MKEVRQTYHEMIIAIVLLGLIFGITGGIFTKQYIVFPVSIIIGCAVAVGTLSHMMKSVSIIVELDSETAKKYGTRQSFLRIFVMGLMLCVACYYSDYVNPWGVLLGMFTLKFSAHLQRPVHILINKFIRKGRGE